MKLIKFLGIVCLLNVMIVSSANSQSSKPAKAPTSFKMYLEGKALNEIALEDALKWCELTPPTMLGNDSVVYFLVSCQVNFFTMKPLQNKEFGLGEGGIPIMATRAISQGKTGDAIVLKDVNCIDSAGNKITMSVISFKLK